jgi:anti-sigma28 factor (negative regulator of flagellin synthesis)
MRIDPRVTVTPVDTKKSDAKASKPASTGSSDASVVVLSSAASAISPAETSETIAARLDKIRSMLQKGTYPVDLDLLAARIVDDETMRGGKVS